MPTLLAQLKIMTTIVADTGDMAAIRRHQPTDATTNPSLLLKAVTLPTYAPLLAQAIAYGRRMATTPAAQVQQACDRLVVGIGKHILSIIPGLVSTEVDARLSFDTAATVDKARQLIALYQQIGADTRRVLIKIAATWEGIKAAEILEQEGIHCNLTLLFNLTQAQACATAGVYLISPFVGRILDWYQQTTNRDYPPTRDPGVLSVQRIYHYYKQHGYPTIIMGASFRNIGEIIALAGCDRLTIAPALLDELAQTTGTLTRQLTADPPHGSEEPQPVLTEAPFRWAMNDDAMATEKLAEGIRLFARDQRQLENLIANRI